MKNSEYINIQGWMLNDLGLSGNKLLIYARIYGFSQDGQSKFRASYQQIADSFKISKPTAINLIRELEVDGLILVSRNESDGVLFNLYSCILPEEKEPVKTPEIEPEKIQTAVDYLKKACAIRFEQDFLFPYSSQIKELEKFYQDFNDTCEQEELFYSVKVLIPRIRKYARNWINNQSKKSYQNVKKEESKGYHIPVGG